MFDETEIAEERTGVFMNELVDLLRERYSGFAFSLNRVKFLWELRCYENHRERWRMRGSRTEIEREMRFLLEGGEEAA